MGHGGDTFDVLLTGAGGEVAGVVEDHLDGTYSVTYKAPLGGVHELSVRHSGKHTCGSPFSVAVMPGTTHRIHDP